jgi:SAM-dependent methyltransferase
MQEMFTRAYQSNEWHGGSGTGSTPETTVAYRRLIDRLIRTAQIKSVLDLGCGDWQFSRLIGWGGADYLGIDVVPEVIAANQLAYAGPGVRFVHADFRHTELPKADLVLVKDVLQHWSNAQVTAFLPRLVKFPWALIANTRNGIRENQDIPDGAWRPLDLRLPPFNLAATELLTYDAGHVDNPLPDLKTVLMLA